jgi:hypothetical protein
VQRAASAGTALLALPFDGYAVGGLSVGAAGGAARVAAETVGLPPPGPDIYGRGDPAIC